MRMMWFWCYNPHFLGEPAYHPAATDRLHSSDSRPVLLFRNTLRHERPAGRRILLQNSSSIRQSNAIRSPYVLHLAYRFRCQRKTIYLPGFCTTRYAYDPRFLLLPYQSNTRNRQSFAIRLPSSHLPGSDNTIHCWFLPNRCRISDPGCRTSRCRSRFASFPLRLLLHIPENRSAQSQPQKASQELPVSLMLFSCCPPFIPLFREPLREPQNMIHSAKMRLLFYVIQMVFDLTHA